MFCKIHERPCQFFQVRLWLHDWSQFETLRPRDDLCYFGSWPSELFEVLTGLVSQTPFTFIDVVAVASELVLFNIDCR